MARAAQVFNSLFIVLPKAGLVGALWWVGTWRLAISDSEDSLILNTVAIGFVLDVDELLFNVCTPHFIKEALAKLPPIVVKPYSELEGALVRASKKMAAAFKKESAAERGARRLAGRDQSMLNFLRLYGFTNLFNCLAIIVVTFLRDANRCGYSLFSYLDASWGSDDDDFVALS